MSLRSVDGRSNFKESLPCATCSLSPDQRTLNREDLRLRSSVGARPDATIFLMKTTCPNLRHSHLDTADAEHSFVRNPCEPDLFTCNAADVRPPPCGDGSCD
jgi:hypothetical protein